MNNSIVYQILKFNIFLEHEDSCIILHRQEISVDGDSVMEINSDRNTRSQKLINTKNDAMNVLIQVKYNYVFFFIYMQQNRL